MRLCNCLSPNLFSNLLTYLLTTFGEATSSRYPEYPVEVVFVNTKEMAVVFSQYNRRRSAAVKRII